MFEPNSAKVFGLPPGVDFPAELVEGLLSRMAGRPPEDMARVQIFLNTKRMLRRVQDLLVARGAMILPRLSLITALAQDPALGLAPPVSSLRRRLELAKLIAALLDRQPELAPRNALYDLSDSLARLMDEMHGEGLNPAVLENLDVADHAAHWGRTRHFLGIVARFFDGADEPDIEARQRLAVERLAALWRTQTPTGPVVIAGSTGSRGTTLELMEAVAKLPQGALILPGYDFDQPGPVWDSMADAMTAEDHPQFRFRRLLDRMNLQPDAVDRWTNATAQSPERSKLISLALRPAPVTDQWLVEGPGLGDLRQATEAVSLLQAPSQRIEALAIALMLREVAEGDGTAALISPDRNLTRQVTAALDRWGILPDDSAGRPLALSPPGRLLREVAALMGEKLTADRLLALLKHPLTASGGDRGLHLLLTRDLELSLRQNGPVFPLGDDLRQWATARPEPNAQTWADAIGPLLDRMSNSAVLPLVEQVRLHRSLVESFARAEGAEGSGALWDKAAGSAALTLMEELEREAPHGGAFSTAEYRDLFMAHIAGAEVREAVQPHPRIMIWGTLEARVQGANLVILGGMNDGVWPSLSDPDPWLNRRMRKEAGLLLPERQIGLAAHDFQQAIAAPRVVLTRAVRDAEAETVPSRWLNRLVNLMSGLREDNKGPEAVASMVARGDLWVARALAIERPETELGQDPRLQPALRPAPQPPVSARPKRLSLTRISQLIRDPYSVYARHILRLRPLEPLRAEPDARGRGTIFHEILEQFVRERPAEETRAAAQLRLLALADAIVSRETPFPAAQILWKARFERSVNHFLTEDTRHDGTALALETEGSLAVPGVDFTLFGTPDRIDRLPDGKLHLIDYKTGTPPSRKQQDSFDKQLRLAAIMATQGGFPDIGPHDVARISYIGLGAAAKVETTDEGDLNLDREWNRFVTLVTRYAQRSTGYAARRAVFESRIEGDYDHLARFGEWQMSDHAAPTPVGEDSP